MAQHRDDYKRKDIATKKVKSFDLLQYDDAYIELVEKFPCDTKEQLLAREGHHIRTTGNCINRCIAGQTRQQTQKQYRITHQEQIKEYNQKHKEELTSYFRKYRVANKKELNAKRNKQVECVCGSLIRHCDKSRHEKTKNHISQTELNRYLQLPSNQIIQDIDNFINLFNKYFDALTIEYNDLVN